LNAWRFGAVSVPKTTEMSGLIRDERQRDRPAPGRGMINRERVVGPASMGQAIEVLAGGRSDVLVVAEPR
jgi:hypothetical protein